METFFGVLLLIFMILLLAGPLLRRWLGPLLQGWMMHRVEDQFRRAAGMPSRKEEKKQRKARRKRGENSSTREYGRKPHTARQRQHAPIIPKEYAEDVEFVEIKEFSDDSEITYRYESLREEITWQTEEQVEEAQFEDIKDKDVK